MDVRGLGVAVLLAGAVTATAGPDEIQYRPDQTPGTPAQVERGHVLFAMCAGCHGQQGEGMVGMAPRLNSRSYLAIVSNDFIRRTVTEGRAGTNMVAWGSSLPAEDVDALVAYIRSWQDSDGVPLDESRLKGDPDRGRGLYYDVCARCHGGAGAGYSATGPGTGIGRRAFLDQASDGMLRAVVRYGKDDTPMQSFSEDNPARFADLSAKDVDSIISFLRRDAW